MESPYLPPIPLLENGAEASIQGKIKQKMTREEGSLGAIHTAVPNDTKVSTTEGQHF